MMSTDLRGDDNKLAAVVRLFKEESKAVTIAGLALLASILAVLMAFMALNDAKYARIKAELQIEAQNKVIDEYQRKVEIYDVRYANWVAYMRAHGIELPEEE